MDAFFEQAATYVDRRAATTKWLLQIIKPLVASWPKDLQKLVTRVDCSNGGGLTVSLCDDKTPPTDVHVNFTSDKISCFGTKWAPSILFGRYEDIRCSFPLPKHNELVTFLAEQFSVPVKGILRMMGFADLKFQDVFAVGSQAKHMFTNGFGVSVIKLVGPVGLYEDLYDLAIIDASGEVCCTTDLGNVTEHVSSSDIDKIMSQVALLNTNGHLPGRLFPGSKSVNH